MGRYVVARAIWLTRRWLDTSLRSDGLKGWRANTSLRSISVEQQQPAAPKGDDDEHGLLPLLCLTFGSVTTIVGVCMLMEHDGMDRLHALALRGRAAAVPAVPAAGRVRGLAERDGEQLHVVSW